MSRFFIFIFLFSSTYSLHAAFEDNGTGARPAALGNAYAAAGDDILSLYYNPAGLARIQQLEASTEYTKLYAGLSDGSNIGQYMVSAGIPLRSGVLAAGWRQLDLSGLYQERTLSLGYGRWIGVSCAVGGSVKQLHHAFTPPSTTVDDNGQIHSGTPSLFTQEGDGKSAYAVDLGALYRLGRYQWVGAAIQNLNTPNVALDSADSDRVARTWRLGWAYEDTRKLSVTTEFGYEQAPDGPTDKTISGGAEKGWSFGSAGVAFARGGLAIGTRGERRVTTGFGVTMDAVQIDYAFVMDLSGVSIGATSGIHRLSATYRFRTSHPAPVLISPPPAPPAPGVDLAPKEPPRTSIINVPVKDLDSLFQDLPEIDGPPAQRKQP